MIARQRYAQKYDARENANIKSRSTPAIAHDNNTRQRLPLARYDTIYHTRGSLWTRKNHEKQRNDRITTRRIKRVKIQHGAWRPGRIPAHRRRMRARRETRASNTRVRCDFDSLTKCSANNNVLIMFYGIFRDNLNRPT